MPRIDVHFLPDLVQPESLVGTACVVIDVLRATTSIVQALAAGAAAVLPALEVADALALARSLEPGSVLLGGERGGVRIAGFDLGNSPSEYTPDRLRGKTLVFTTTNGTRAMHRCHQAARILLAAFVNLSAVAEALDGLDRVHLVCAGTEGEITREDCLLAGALVERLTHRGTYTLNDQALLACDAWRALSAQRGTAPPMTLTASVRQTLRLTQGGRNLLALGLERDLDDAGTLDSVPLVPELTPRGLRISVLGRPPDDGA